MHSSLSQHTSALNETLAYFFASPTTTLHNRWACAGGMHSSLSPHIPPLNVSIMPFVRLQQESLGVKEAKLELGPEFDQKSSEFESKFDKRTSKFESLQI